MRHIRAMYFASTIIWDLLEYADMHGVGSKHLRTEFNSLKRQKYVSYEVMIRTLNHIRIGLNDENLGLNIGEHLSLKATAPVDQIMLNSQTLEESINNAIEYSKVISDALECSLEKSDQYFAVVYEENPNWKVCHKEAKRDVLDMTLLANIKSLAAYTDRHYFPIVVHFAYEKPKHLNEYYRLFNCSLKFNQPVTKIVYQRYIIDRYKRDIQFGLLENLKEKVLNEIVQLSHENHLIYELKKCILNKKPYRLSVKEAAVNLNVSSRTLQRKLTELNTTFKGVEYEMQIKLSKTYLEEGKKSIDEISYLLGFSESSAFIRFFKSVMDQTPVEYGRKFT